MWPAFCHVKLWNCCEFQEVNSWPHYKTNKEVLHFLPCKERKLISIVWHFLCGPFAPAIFGTSIPENCLGNLPHQWTPQGPWGAPCRHWIPVLLLSHFPIYRKIKSFASFKTILFNRQVAVGEALWNPNLLYCCLSLR